MMANYTPNLGSFKSTGMFKFWCQKVLPLVYDDSLSYYELLCKVVNYLNDVIQNMDTANDNVTKLYHAFIELQNYVNNYLTDINIENEVKKVFDEYIKDSTIISDYLQSIYKDLMRNGIAPTSVRYFTLGANKEYTNIKECMDAVTAYNNPSIVLVYPGQYDTGVFDGVGLMLPDYCYMIGVGDRLSVHLSCFVQNEVYSTINLSKNNGIYNLFLTGDGCRYVVHDDFSDFDIKATRRVVDCVMQGHNLILKWVYGAGIKSGDTLIVENCMFISRDAGAFSIHNMTRATDVCHVKLNNCQFIGNNTVGAVPYTVRLSGVMNYEGSDVWTNTYVEINNCQNVFIALDTEYATSAGHRISPYMISGNGVWGFTLLYDTQFNPSNITNDDMFVSGYPYEENMVVGRPCFNAGGQLVMLGISDDLPIEMAEGVLLTPNSVLGNSVVLAKAGIFPPSVFGIDPAGTNITNKYVGCEYANPLGVIEVANKSGKGIFGVTTNYGYVKLIPPYKA